MIVRQAANVLDLLEFFVRRKEPATLSAIADSLGWPRSSTFNLIQTLVDRGYLYEPRPRSGYYPSPRWFSVAQHVAAAEPLPEFVHALVGELSAETGETAAIGAPAGINAIFVDVQESPAAVRYFAQVGHRLPIHATSTGRALLAQYTREERFAVYRRIEFRQWSPTTPISIDAVEAEFAARPNAATTRASPTSVRISRVSRCRCRSATAGCRWWSPDRCFACLIGSSLLPTPYAAPPSATLPCRTRLIRSANSFA